MDLIQDWVRQAREKGASDLHLEGGTPLVMRIRGELSPFGAPIPAEAVLQSVKELLGPAQWQEFLARRSFDFSRSIQGVRCRINVFQTLRGVAMAIRVLTSFQNSLRDCNLHPDFRNFLKAETGLLLVSGPTGSGKSTTLAAFVEELNQNSRKQILTVESPIEYFFANRRSFIRQREVPTHTPSFEQAIIDSMREDPDVLVIGEMRTPDVMRLTLNAAETGHLVLATVHSSSCAEALSRICMSFPAEIQGSIRAQLADCLIGVICQRLTSPPHAPVRVPYCEVLVANSGVKATIRGGNLSQIASSIQTGGEDGMWSFERYQRWIDQKKDWVLPSQATPMDRSPEPTRIAAPSIERRAAPPVKSRPADDGRIEIDVAEDDLEALGKRLADTED